MACSELSDATLVTKGTLTGVLDRPETKGLIRREPLTNDRRAVKIRLTATDQTTRLFSRIRDSFHQR